MPEASETEFEGFRLLVVEDDYHVAKSLGRALTALGCVVIGPVATAEEACQLVKEAEIDGAFLDVRLAPGTSAPVARALLYRGHPFVFITGFSDLDMLPEDLRGYRVLHKPVERATVCSAIREMAGGRWRDRKEHT